MGVLDRKAREFSRREREILDAAFELFMEKGFDPVTVDMIAERAEVGKGTIYKHFGSKSDIFLRLVIRYDRAIQAKMMEIDPEAPVLVQYRQVLRIFWDSAMEDLRAFSVFRGCEKLLMVSDLCPETRASVRSCQNVYEDLMHRMYQRAVDEQIFRDAPVKYFGVAGKSLLMGAIDQVVAGDVEHGEDLYAFLENILIKGFMR